MPEQIPFGDAEFVLNAEPRCPCILLLDVSGSMQGEPIKELNAGLVQLKDELCADSLTVKRVELTIISFGAQVKIVTESTSPESYQPPILVAEGPTPMGEAIKLGLDLLQQRKASYRTHAIQYYRPWIFLITDGGPTDEWSPPKTGWV